MPVCRPTACFAVVRLETCVKSWMCVNCGYVYVEAAGDPAGGIPPGTRWEELPADWVCPDCGLGKREFEMAEID